MSQRGQVDESAQQSHAGWRGHRRQQGDKSSADDRYLVAKDEGSADDRLLVAKNRQRWRVNFGDVGVCDQ